MNQSESLYWRKFLEWISNRNSNFAFRGISNKEHLLISSVGREDKINKYTFKKEMYLFNTFKLRTNLLVNPKSDLELLTIAQHYALPTRLLDWTENPLVACFFAIQNKEFDGRIYAFNYKNAPNINLNDNPFHIQDISVVFPPITSDRINLQKGLFTIHPNPNKPCLITPLNMGSSYHNGKLVEIDTAYDFIEELNSNHFNIQRKEKNESDKDYQKKYYSEFESIVFDIKKDYKPYFEKQIRLLGIDETIFGDIESIAKKTLYECNNSDALQKKNSEKNEDYSYIRHKVKTNLLSNIRAFSEIVSINSIVRSNISVWVENKENNYHNIAGVLELHPNYFFSNEEFFVVTPENSLKIKKINSTLSKLIDRFSENWGFYNTTYQVVEFRLRYYGNNSLSKLEFDSKKHNIFNPIDLAKVSQMYKLFDELLSEKEREIFNNYEIKLESDEFNNFSSDIIFLDKLKPISDYFLQSIEQTGTN